MARQDDPDRSFRRTRILTQSTVGPTFTGQSGAAPEAITALPRLAERLEYPVSVTQETPVIVFGPAAAVFPC